MLEVSGATVSRHLGILLDAGLVDSRKAGRWVYYRLRASCAADNPARGEFALVLAWLKAELAVSEDVAGTGSGGRTLGRPVCRSDHCLRSCP